jgi:hypothetical protein
MVIELDKEVLTSEITSTLLPLILTPDEENIVRVSRIYEPVLFPDPLSRLMTVLMKIWMLLDGEHHLDDHHQQSHCDFSLNSVMRRLAEIPRLGTRLKLFLTILTWKDGARKFLEKVALLADAGVSLSICLS